jgi:hypothetical protein
MVDSRIALWVNEYVRTYLEERAQHLTLPETYKHYYLQLAIL